MDMFLNEEQLQIRDLANEFFKREVSREMIREADEHGIYPREIIKKLADIGLWSMMIPQEYGGEGRGMLDYVVFMERAGYHYLAVALIQIRVASWGFSSLLKYGNEEQKREILPKIASGDAIIAIGLTEPNAGSDASATQTMAVADGDDYIINGTKMWCSSANIADYIVLATRTNTEVKKQAGLSVFILRPKDISKGLTIRKIPKLGTNVVASCEVNLENVRVSKKDMLGELDHGWPVITSALEHERISVGAANSGGGQRCVDDAVAYAKQRKQFGQPIGSFQMVQHKLVEAQALVEAARLFTYQAGYMYSKGMRCVREASLAKLYGARAYFGAAHDGIQVMGSYGYSKEYDMERHFRDARLFEIGGGTSEIVRLLIAREMGL